MLQRSDHCRADISYQYSRKQTNIAIRQHNIIFRKKKGYMFDVIIRIQKGVYFTTAYQV
jgi:hypothetical protein